MSRSSNRSTAVMERKAAEDEAARSDAGLTPAEQARRTLWRQLNFFPTPPWAARAGAELIRSLDPESRTALEPACGLGHMAEPLKAYFETVHAADIHPFGYGAVRDFLKDGGPEVDWVITNPPFSLAAEFLDRGLQTARRGVALLVRLAFMESAGRYELLYGARPVTVIAPFAERVAIQLGSWNPTGSSATAYAWFVWVKGAATAPVVQPIPPGAKKRLTRPHDARRFGQSADAPLFDGDPK